MKRIFYVMILVVISITVKGQGEAKSILDKMSETYKAMPGYEIAFVQKVISESEVIERLSGSAAVAKEKFVLKFQDQHIYCNGPVLWTYLVETQELTISNFEPEEGAINPAKIYDIYKEGFNFEYKRLDEVNGEPVHVIELISTDEDADYPKISMYIGQKDSYLKGWDLIDYDGVISAFEVSSFKPNQNYDAKFFEFDEKANPVQHKEDLRNE
ncbi:LolA family protein [Roseivirga sp.]|uniref:LolA family protein n=1 Tax=Roseivirga sp. TaxID=1964215 RepID=UPI003B8C96CB